MNVTRREGAAGGQDGAAIVEYGILIALVAVVFIGGATVVSLGARAAFQSQSNDLSTLAIEDGSGSGSGTGGAGSGSGGSGTGSGGSDTGSESGFDPSSIASGDLNLQDDGSFEVPGVNNVWSTNVSISLVGTVPDGTILTLEWSPSNRVRNNPTPSSECTVFNRMCPIATQAQAGTNNANGLTLEVTEATFGSAISTISPTISVVLPKPS